MPTAPHTLQEVRLCPPVLILYIQTLGAGQAPPTADGGSVGKAWRVWSLETQGLLTPFLLACAEPLCVLTTLLLGNSFHF